MPVVSLSPIHTGMLSSVYNTFGKEESYKKYVLLKQFAKLSIKNYTVLKTYHELLLFLKAYPDNKQILDIVTTELERVIASAKKIMQGDNSKAQQSLSGSGIAGTVLIAQYSYPVTKWLIENFRAQYLLIPLQGIKNMGPKFCIIFFRVLNITTLHRENLRFKKGCNIFSGKIKTHFEILSKQFSSQLKMKNYVKYFLTS